MQNNKLYGFIFFLTLSLFFLMGNFQMNKSAAFTSSNMEVETPIAQSQLIAQTSGEFTLPPLPYEYDALDEYIDSETMTLHHDKHHAGYVKNLNKAIASHPELQGQSVEDLLLDIDNVPEDIFTAVVNNGGGHANHTMFWSIMSPDGGGEPTGEIAEAINETFGDFETFQEEFNSAGKTNFGSGWVWLVMNEDNSLEVTSTPNQDSPFMDGQYPIMGNDVWEHAYYLKYQNKRADYLEAWWNVVNWSEINNRFAAANDFME